MSVSRDVTLISKKRKFSRPIKLGECYTRLHNIPKMEIFGSITSLEFYWLNRVEILTGIIDLAGISSELLSAEY